MKISFNVLSVWCILFLAAQASANLKCWKCENAVNETDCLQNGEIETCKDNQDACATHVRYHHGKHPRDPADTFAGYLIIKRCKQSHACHQNFVQNPRAAWQPSQCNNHLLPDEINSVCRCCCGTDLCNQNYTEDCTSLRTCKVPPTLRDSGEYVCTGAENKYGVGSTCAVVCNDGYELTKVNPSNDAPTCGETLEWSFQFPKCRKTTCRHPLAPAFGNFILTSHSLVYDTNATYSCQHGYSLSGNKFLSCLRNGSWSGEPPICQEGDGACNDVEEGFCSNGKCTVNGDDDIRCDCGSGWRQTDDDQDCEDIDECTEQDDNCDINAECINNAGSFGCQCNSGYIGNGFTCNDENECETGNNDCDVVTEVCVNTDGSYTCECGDSFVFDPVSGDCQDENECETGNNNCDVNTEVCVNTYGSYTCECVDGFEFDPVSGECQVIDDCESGPCHPLATCQNNDSGYSCTCNSGYTGDGINNCDNINECESDQDNNCHENASCVDNLGGFACFCNDGFDGDGVNFCDPIVCDALDNYTDGERTCTDGVQLGSNCEYTCDEEGYELHPTDNITCLDDGKWSDEPPCCRMKCPPFAMVDVAMVMDASSSISSEDFNKTCDFTKLFIDQFKKFTSFAAFKYDKIIYDDTAMYLDPNRINEDTLSGIDEICREKDGRGTKTGKALGWALSEIFSKPENRKDAKDVVILITDGNPSDKAKTEANANQLRAVHQALIFVIAIQPPNGDLDIDLLQKVAGDPNRVILIDDYSELDLSNSIFTETLCEASHCGTAADPEGSGDGDP